MEKFYSIEENFKFLYDNIYVLLSNKPVAQLYNENWLVNWYICDKYNTTRAVEKYAADLIIPKLKESEIPDDVFKSIIDKKLNGCYESYNDVELTLEDKLYMIDNIQKVKINESTFSYIIQDFECEEIVKYIEENYHNESYLTKKDVLANLSEDTKEVLSILSNIQNIIMENTSNHDKLKLVRNYNSSILYKYKYVTEASECDLPEIYKKLEGLLSKQNDTVIEYSLQAINHYNKLIENLVPELSLCNEEFIYEQAIEKFNNMVESLFFEDREIEVEEVVRLYEITEALCEYESTMEASSRIISKGTEKVTKAIGNASAKSKGMGSVDSKLAQVKRGAKIVDDRASDAINNKIDRILNFTRDQKREKLITGKNTIRVSKVLKAIIGILAAGTALKAKPLLGAAVTLIGILGARGLSKATEVREKRRIMLDLETELKITREKIEDAKGENAKEKKYQLMRIESQLEKEIFRIKHGLKYY